MAFVAALVLAPNTADPDEAVIDLPGYVLSGIGIGALVYGIIDGAEAGWTATNALDRPHGGGRCARRPSSAGSC